MYLFIFSFIFSKAAADEEASGAGDPDATSLLRGMSSRASRVEAEITRRLRSEFAALVKPNGASRAASPLSSPVRGPGLGRGQGAVGRSGSNGGVLERGRSGREGKKRQALLSCLRPFSALGSGIEAEKQFARFVVVVYCIVLYCVMLYQRVLCVFF